MKWQREWGGLGVACRLYDEDLEFYSNDNGKLLKGFKQRGDKILCHEKVTLAGESIVGTKNRSRGATRGSHRWVRQGNWERGIKDDSWVCGLSC